MDSAGFQVLVEHGPQLAPVDFGCRLVALGGNELRQDRAVVVLAALGLALDPGQRPEGVHQPGVLQGDLAGVGVQVERSSRVAGVHGGVGVVHHRLKAVPLQDSCAHQAGGAAADDGDAGWGRHG